MSRPSEKLLYRREYRFVQSPFHGMGPQRGLVIVEVLVSLIVIAIGLLGLLALQTKAQQTTVEAYQRSQALIIADDMLNRLYANAVEATSCYLTGDFEKRPGQWTDGDREYLGCSDNSDRDLAEWNAMLRGAGELVADGGGATREVGAMQGAVGCIRQDPLDPTLLHVAVAWQGMQELRAPVDTCGQGLYDAEVKRRVVSLPVRLSNWR